MSDEYSRYETNRKFMKILIRYNVDMTKINYSCSCRTIHIYGSLSCKDSLKDFNMLTVMSLVSELKRIPRIQSIDFNLDNWIIGSEHGELNVMKSKGKGAGTHPGSRHP